MISIERQYQNEIDELREILNDCKRALLVPVELENEDLPDMCLTIHQNSLQRDKRISVLETALNSACRCLVKSRMPMMYKYDYQKEVVKPAAELFGEFLSEASR